MKTMKTMKHDKYVMECDEQGHSIIETMSCGCKFIAIYGNNGRWVTCECCGGKRHNRVGHSYIEMCVTHEELLEMYEKEINQ